MDGLIGLVSGQVIYQDFKSRTGSIYALLILAVLACIMAFNHSPAFPVLKYFSFNISFLALVGITQYILIYFKKNKNLNPINKVIGLFDVLYLLILCTCFSPRNFLFFIIFTALLGCIHGFIYQFRLKRKTVFIPFAAYLAIGHILFIGIKYITGTSLYNDLLIRNLFA